MRAAVSTIFGDSDPFSQISTTAGIAPQTILQTLAPALGRLEAVVAENQQTALGVPRRPRKRNARGLPKWKELRSLATSYLTLQAKHWPSMVGSEALPVLTEAAVDRFARQFRRCFRRGKFEIFVDDSKRPAYTSLGISYLRYSADNSNPRSLDQQLKKQLEKAKEMDVFVPWQYVFADARVTGTTSDRRGYQLVKKVLQRVDNAMTLFVDDIGRASRDMVEALMLARLVERKDKGFIAVSDGFDLKSPMATMMLTLFAAMQEWFIEQLIAKVNRGLDDAFDKFASTGKPPTGYRLGQLYDAHGRPVTGKDGEATKTYVIDPKEAAWVLLAFTLYGIYGWKLKEISRLFNQNSVGGRCSWHESQVSRLLRRHRYAGISLYRMTYRIIIETGKKKGKFKTKIRPRKKWRAKRAPQWRIVPWKLWKLVQERLKVNDAIYKRNPNGGAAGKEAYPDKLWQPLCRCGSLFVLGHSEPYSSYTCNNGNNEACGCVQKGYKAVRIFNNCMLEFVRAKVLSKENIERLVKDANRHLAKRPVVPVSDDRIRVLETQKQDLVTRGKKLAEKIESAPSGKPSAFLTDRLAVVDADLKKVNADLAAALSQKAPPPPPLTINGLNDLLADLEKLLNSNVRQAAPILRQLTGPVTLYSQAEKGQKKPVWYAEFTYDLMPVLLKIAKGKKNCPTSNTLEYLSVTGWTKSENAKVKIAKKLQHELLAENLVFLDMIAKGASDNAISQALNVPWERVGQTREWMETGRQPVWKPQPKRERRQNGTARPRPTPKYLQHGDDVVRLVDEQHMPNEEIAKLLGISKATIAKAYKHAHRDDIIKETVKGRRFLRPMPRKLNPSQERELVGLRRSGYSAEEVAKVFEISANTVRRAIRRSEAEIKQAK